MHNAGLAVLGNSLQVVSNGESSTMLGSLLQSEEWMGNSGIVNALLSELSLASHRPHDAYQAARSMHVLLDSAPPEVKRILMDRGCNAMRDSRKVGLSRHSLLASECD